MKKVAVINFSGNVGKSSIARYLLAPRMNCDVVSVESINDTGSASKSKATVRGKEITELREHLLMSSGLVVDIGASNVEDFMDSLSEYEDGLDEFDYFIIPTVASLKQQEDTVVTVGALRELGVDSSNIVIVFNQYDRKSGDLRKQFKGIFEDLTDSDCVLNEKYVVPKHGFFEAFQEEKRSFNDVVTDETDYRSLIGETDDKDEQVEYVRKLGMKSLAKGISKKLDNVFEEMTAN